MPKSAVPLTGSQRAVAAGLVALALMSCGKKPPEPPKPGPPSVSIVELKPQDVVLKTELPGRTAAFKVAEVRPQVGGLVRAQPFREGSDVKAGDLLYQIEPATFSASVANAEATLGKAEASLVSTRLKADRYKELVAIQAVSNQDADDAAAAVQQGLADAAAARALLATQRINLAWTRVTAPISGRIGRSSVTQGALVSASQTSALATVQQLDPIYVDLTQSSDEALRLRRALAAGTLASSGADAAKVSLLLKDGTPYAHTGTLRFAEMTVDPTTSAVTLRALFPNPKGELLPGLYVRAVIEEGVKRGALLVPQPAVTRNDAGKPVAYAVAADNKLEQRVLVTERAVGNQWLVTSGLKAGDRVVVEGMQSAKAGVAVSIVPARAASAASGAGGSASAAGAAGAAPAASASESASAAAPTAKN